MFLCRTTQEAQDTFKPYEDILMDLYRNNNEALIAAKESINIVYLLLNMFCDMQEHANVGQEDSYEIRRFVLKTLLNAKNLLCNAEYYRNLNYYSHSSKPCTFNIYLDALVTMSQCAPLTKSLNQAQDIINVLITVLCIRNNKLRQHISPKALSDNEKREIIGFDTLFFDERDAYIWQIKYFSFLRKQPLSINAQDCFYARLATLLAMPNILIVSQMINAIDTSQYYNALAPQHLHIILQVAANRNDENQMLVQLLTKINPIALYYAVIFKEEEHCYKKISLLDHLQKRKHDDAYICICLMAIFGYLVKCYKKSDDSYKQKLADFVRFCKRLMPLILSRDGFFIFEDPEQSSETASIDSTSNPPSLLESNDPFNIVLRNPIQNEKNFYDVEYQTTCKPLADTSPRISGYDGTLMFFSVITNSSKKDFASRLPKPHQKAVKALAEVPKFVANYFC